MKKKYKITLHNKKEIISEGYDFNEGLIFIEINNKDVIIPFTSILYMEEI